MGIGAGAIKRALDPAKFASFLGSRRVLKSFFHLIFFKTGSITYPK